MRQGKKGQAVDGEKLRFRDYGEVTEEFLDEFESHHEPPLFTPKELVTLLKGLLVFAEMSEDVYFMPCLLQVVAWEVVEKHRVSREKALALHFPDSGPLMGMFCSTVAYLLSPGNSHPYPWRVVQKETGAPECLHRNVIKFTIPKYTGTISLIDHFTHFELHLHTLPKKAPELWKLAHDAVFAGLKKAQGRPSATQTTLQSRPSYAPPTQPNPIPPLWTRTMHGYVQKTAENLEMLLRALFHGCLHVVSTVRTLPCVQHCFDLIDFFSLQLLMCQPHPPCQTPSRHCGQGRCMDMFTHAPGLW